MSLHLNHIKHILCVGKMRFCHLFYIAAFFCCLQSQGQIKNEGDLKKQAEHSFEDEDYNSAYKLYAQLVSLYPKDPDYNYRLGVCMLYTEPDKKKPFSYLQIATKNPKDAPKDAKFYLAKTYQINYNFDEALKLYTEYKEIGSQASIKKLQVDREIQACKNGKRLLSNLSDLVIINKKQLNEADYFRSYDVTDIGGKLLVKPDEFKTAYDKKKKDKSVIYLPKNTEQLYYSSYGENGATGRDIYMVNKLSNGGWSKPQALPGSINTNYDEDYPFLHPNGKTLYFSSKGHNSMGGYDIFKTTFDSQTQTWSEPVNLNFPINSPDDDILFITDSLEKTAFFSTGRYSPYGKIDVLKINTERRPMNFAVLKGTVLKENASQSLKSKITVKNAANGEIIDTYQAQDNGDYNMELPNGGKFIFTVETPGIPAQSESIQLPVAYSLKPYKQVISYDNQILKIINYFESETTDDNYAMMLGLIEKKAKLEVNENEPYNTSLKDPSKNQTTDNQDPNISSVTTTNPSVVGDKENSTNTNKNITNEQLLDMAKEDAKEASDETIKLKQEAEDAFGLATQKTAEAEAKQKEADEAAANANTITDVTRKNEELIKVNELQGEAKTATNIANLATNLAKKLESDAITKQKEADLTNQYISQLEAITKNKNNKEALTKLEQIQKELDGLSKQKNQSDELYTSLKAESELKENEVIRLEKTSSDIESEINTIQSEAKALENDLSNETDNALKENITAQIREINNDIDLKNKDLSVNNTKIETLKKELGSLNKELAIAAKILNEKTDVIAVDDNNNTATTNTTSIGIDSYENLTSKYNEKISATIDETNKNEIVVQNDILKDYNKDINNLIKKDKNELSKIKDASAKNNLNQEIKKLEKLISDNETLMANNVSKIKQLESVQAVNGNVNSTKIQPDNITNNDTVSKLTTNQPLANTDSKIELDNETVNANKTANAVTIFKSDTNDNTDESIEIFSFNGYKGASSIRLKENISRKFDSLKQKEADLMNQIAIEEKNSKSTSTPNTDNLVADAEALNNKAYDQRKESALKNGSEKDSLLKEAIRNETLAIDKKLEASIIQEKENKNNFSNNIINLNELQKLTGTRESNDISLAKLLMDEANINFSQAEKMREEANTYPGSAKLGGLSNAEEKENEALSKQQKALDILTKVNPDYKIKTSESNLNTSTTVTNIKSELTKTQQAKANIYLDLSNINQKELKLQADSLLMSPVFLSPSNKIAQDFKKQSDNLNKEAKNYITQSLTAKTPNEKATLLLKANEKEIEALQALDKSKESLIDNSPKAYQFVGTNTINKDEITTNNSGNSNTINTNSLVTTTTNTNTVNTTETTKVNQINRIKTDTVVSTKNTLKPTDIADEVKQLKSGLNNPSETELTNFTSFVNLDAIILKNKAFEKIKNSLNQDRVIGEQLQGINQITNTGTTESLNQKNSTDLITEAEKLNDEAAELRKLAVTKPSDEREKDIAKANELELNAIAKKIEAAAKQQALNRATYLANQQSLKDLAIMAEGKNISELNSADMQITEADLFFNQAQRLRAESNEYPTDAAKLGGYNNAEEKEFQALAKQQAVLDIYKKYFSNYVPKQAAIASDNQENTIKLDAAKNLFNANTQQHIDGLLLLAKALEKDYQARLFTLAPNLKTNQIALKTKAQDSYKKSKDLLTLANGTTDLIKKKNLLIDANLAGQNAISLLNQISGNPPVAINQLTNSNIPPKIVNTNSTPKTSTNQVKTVNATVNTKTVTKTAEPVANAQPPIDKANPIAKTEPANTSAAIANTPTPDKVINPVVNSSSAIKLKGLEVKNTNVYSNNNPIPIDEKIPDGLVFKVQIGAFRAPLPNNTFKGLSPVIAQTTPSGYLRYMAGNFEEYENAKAVKNDLIRLGYNDAFVVCYYNGKRITLNEAIAKAQNSGQAINSNDIANQNTSAGITANANIPKNEVSINSLNSNTSDAKPVVITKQLEQMNGLLYTVQIGVFTQQVKRSQLYNLSPIYTEKLPSGLYRYTAGIYNQADKLIEDKRKVVNLGVKDAFVSAYYNAKRVSFSEAKKLQLENKNLNMESENPIVFSEAATSSFSTNDTLIAAKNAVNTSVSPVFSNGVVKGPEPTADNGVKTDNNGISYKIQIGAYKNQVPNDVAAKFSSIKTWPVNNTSINGLYIYTIGNFTGNSFAKKLKDEAVSVGITDAFITVYKDGKKLYGAEAAQYLKN